MSNKTYVRLASLMACSAVAFQFGGCFRQDWAIALAGVGGVASGLINLFTVF
jgi:hypothetical protein